jgi:endonuclease-8
MPEGDTIYRAAKALHTAFAGKTVTHFESVYPRLLRIDEDAPLSGRTIERVTASGKHLLIEFSGALALHTHMRMNGSWHIYRPGDRWRKPHSEMRIVIRTAEYEAVAFNVPVAEFKRGGPDLSRLGPDVLIDPFDEQEAIRRIRARNDEEIANVLLDQRAVAGIGNIYKSESLHAARVNPFTKASALSDETLAEILKHARKIMRRAATGRADRQAVYSRGGEPCRKCGSPIQYRKQGFDARGTYWCSKCQGG